MLDESGHVRRTAADRQERKRIIDQVAAVLILEAFLESRGKVTDTVPLPPSPEA